MGLEVTQSGLKSLQESIQRLDEENAAVRVRLASAAVVEPPNKSLLNNSLRAPLDSGGAANVLSTCPPAQLEEYQLKGGVYIAVHSNTEPAAIDGRGRSAETEGGLFVNHSTVSGIPMID